MAKFRHFFVNDTNQISGYDAVECASQADALQQARYKLLADPDIAAIEVWHADHMVGRTDRQAKPSKSGR